MHSCPLQPDLIDSPAVPSSTQDWSATRSLRPTRFLTFRFMKSREPLARQTSFMLFCSVLLCLSLRRGMWTVISLCVCRVLRSGTALVLHISNEMYLIKNENQPPPPSSTQIMRLCCRLRVQVFPSNLTILGEEERSSLRALVLFGVAAAFCAFTPRT